MVRSRDRGQQIGARAAKFRCAMLHSVSLPLVV